MVSRLVHSIGLVAVAIWLVALTRLGSRTGGGSEQVSFQPEQEPQRQSGVLSPGRQAYQDSAHLQPPMVPNGLMQGSLGRT